MNHFFRKKMPPRKEFEQVTVLKPNDLHPNFVFSCRCWFILEYKGRPDPHIVHDPRNPSYPIIFMRPDKAKKYASELQDKKPLNTYLARPMDLTITRDKTVFEPGNGEITGPLDLTAYISGKNATDKL